MGAKTQEGQKGNPASKRMSNDKLKARRSRSWNRGEARKTLRRKDNEQKRRTNLASASEANNLGQTYLTPDQTARALRAARREPLQRAFKLWSRSYPEWLQSVARSDAMAAGELIREAQRIPETTGSRGRLVGRPR